MIAIMMAIMITTTMKTITIIMTFLVPLSPFHSNIHQSHCSYLPPNFLIDPHQPFPCNRQTNEHRPNPPLPLSLRQVSGISTEIFRQIETVENDHDASTAAALEAVERRGEMVVRLLDPRTLSKGAYDQAKRFLALQVSSLGSFGCRGGGVLGGRESGR